MGRWVFLKSYIKRYNSPSRMLDWKYHMAFILHAERLLHSWELVAILGHVFSHSTFWPKRSRVGEILGTRLLVCYVPPGTLYMCKNVFGFLYGNYILGMHFCVCHTIEIWFSSFKFIILWSQSLTSTSWCSKYIVDQNLTGGLLFNCCLKFDTLCMSICMQYVDSTVFGFDRLKWGC